jgi:hypothetical protein
MAIHLHGDQQVQGPGVTDYGVAERQPDFGH